MQGVIDELDMVAKVEKLVRLVRLLQCPVAVMAVQDADLRRHTRVLERRRQQFQFFSDLADFLEHAVIAADMTGDNPAVKFFTADAWLAPAEIQDAAGA